MLKSMCNKVLNPTLKASSKLSQDSQLLSSLHLCYLAQCGGATPEARLWCNAALSQISRGTTMTYLTIRTMGGIYTSSLPSQRSSCMPSSFRPAGPDLCSLSLSSPLVTLSSQAFLFDFPINPWEKKVPNSIREQIHWFPNSKEHLVHVLASGCVCYSWSLAPSRLKRGPWSLPTCVAALGGL